MGNEKVHSKQDKKDTTLGQTKESDAQIQVLDIPNEIMFGLSIVLVADCFSEWRQRATLKKVAKAVAEHNALTLRLRSQLKRRHTS